MRTAIIGFGHLGRIHANCLKQTPEITLVGVYDPSPEARAKASEEGYEVFETLEKALAATDSVLIVSPTISHYDIALAAIAQGRHVFIEKPIASTTEQALEIVQKAREAKVIGQVGHVERYNPAFIAAQSRGLSPMFIEAHRLALFNPRGTDVSIVLDLMIHDLDLVLHLVQSKVEEVHASGVALVSKSPDIANARVEFQNGAVANFTASRMSLKVMRKMRLFQPDAYISMDFLTKKAETFYLTEPGAAAEGALAMELDLGERGKKAIAFEGLTITESNAIVEEQRAFLAAVQQNRAPAVSLEAGSDALALAERILHAIDQNTVKAQHGNPHLSLS